MGQLELNDHHDEQEELHQLHPECLQQKQKGLPSELCGLQGTTNPLMELLVLEDLTQCLQQIPV